MRGMSRRIGDVQLNGGIYSSLDFYYIQITAATDDILRTDITTVSYQRTFVSLEEVQTWKILLRTQILQTGSVIMETLAKFEIR